MRKLPTGEQLRIRAAELGVVDSIDDPAESRGSIYTSLRATVSDAELQRRVIDAEMRNLAHRGWVFAVISAVASVVSALAAAAVFLVKG